eukprot:468856-Hanusia_phi.AAC.1
MTEQTWGSVRSNRGCCGVDFKARPDPEGWDTIVRPGRVLPYSTPAGCTTGSLAGKSRGGGDRLKVENSG